MEPCLICHEELEEDSLTISCEKNHTIHYSCYEAWRKEKYEGDLEEQAPKIPCVMRCETFYRDNFRSYLEVFLLSAKLELFDICDDILRNKLKREVKKLLFEKARDNLGAILFLFEGEHIQWNAEEHLEKVIRDIARCSDTIIVQRFLEFAWKQGFEASHVLDILCKKLYWHYNDESGSAIVKFLITTCGFEPEKYTPLHQLVADEHHNFVIEELIKSGRYDLDEQDKDGWTALHFAVKNNNSSVFTALIDAGARMDILDINSYNAVDTAYYYHRNDYVRHMVEKGGAMTDAKRRESPEIVPPMRVIVHWEKIHLW